MLGLGRQRDPPINASVALVAHLSGLSQRDSDKAVVVSSHLSHGLDTNKRGEDMVWNSLDVSEA